MIKKLSLIKDDEEELIKLQPREEYLFQKAYKEMATKMGLNLNPDDPLHYYDYRALWKETSKLEPDETGHFPSKYKLKGHPNMYVEGIKTKEEKPIGWTERTRGVDEIPEYEPFKPTIEGKVGLKLGIKPKLKIKKLSIIKGKEEDKFKTQLGIGAKAKGGISLPEVKSSAEPEEPLTLQMLYSINPKYNPETSTPIKKIERYNIDIQKLEKEAEIKGGLKPELYQAYEQIIKKYNEVFNEYNKSLPQKPLIEGLPMSKPEEKPKTIGEWFKTQKPTTPEGLKMGIETSLGTWEEQKKANPELQKIEDLANFLPEVPDLPNFKNQNMSKEQSEIAYLYSLQTDTPLPITIKDMQSNLEKYGNISPPKESWGEYFKREGLLKTILFGPDTKYGKAEKLRNQLNNMDYPTAAESFGYKGFVLLTGAQIIDVLFKTPLRIKGRVFSDEEVNNLFARAEKNYNPETKSFNATLSNNDLAAVKTLAPYMRSAIESGKPMQFPVDLKIPQQVSAFGTQLYGGIPITTDEIVNSIVKVGKVTAEMVQGLDPVKLSQVTETLFNYSPALAIQFMEARQKFAVPEGKAVGKPVAPEVKEEIPKAEVKEPIIPKLNVGDKVKFKTFYADIPEGTEAEITKVNITTQGKTELNLDFGKNLTGQKITRKNIPLDVIEVPKIKVKAPIAPEIPKAVEPKKAEPTIEPTPKAIPKELEKTSQFLFNKSFEELKNPELRKVLETSKQPLPDETGKYVNRIGTPAKGLQLRPLADEHARFIFGGFEKGLLTDSHLLVFDKDVSKAVLSDLIEKYRRGRIKAVQVGEISYQEAQKIVDKEIEQHKKDFVKDFPKIEGIVPKEDIEKSTPLWLQGHQVTDLDLPLTILTDGKIQIALNTDKLSFLNKHFPNAEIKSTGENKPVLFMEGEELKAVVMPVRAEEYPFKITSEPTIKIAKEITPGAEVQPTIKKLSKIKPTVKPTIQPLTPEEIAERGKLIKKIHTIKSVKGLTNKEYWQIKRRIKEKYNIPWITSTKMNLAQLRDLTKAMERARPKIIGHQEVITLKTENKIQSLKDNLIDKLQMTKETFNKILKEEHVFKEPKYIDAKNFITEKQGKDIIYRLIDEANILKITLPYKIAVEKNPPIKKMVDQLSNRIKFEHNRRKKDPNELNSMRQFAQIMEVITEAPFYPLFRSLIDTHYENKAKSGKLMKEFEEYPKIIKDEISLHKINSYIVAKSILTNKPESPKDITPKEIEVANKIEGTLKDYEAIARTEMFLDNIEHPEGLPQYLQYKKEINKAKEIYESKGYDDLLEYLKTQEWGIVTSGYSPLQVFSSKIRLHKPKPQSFGKSHITPRKDIEYKESDSNILKRLFSYKRQMDNLVSMGPKVKALITLFNNNLDKFKNPGRMKSVIEVFLRELKGYNSQSGLLNRILNRLYAQAIQTVILLNPGLFAQNIIQNVAMESDKSILIDPRNKTLTDSEIDYMNTYIIQTEAMKMDWLMTREKPLPGLAGPTWLINKIGIYPFSEQTNRHWDFWAKINQVKRAFNNNNDLAQQMKDAKFSDMQLLEQKMALEILAKDGLEAMTEYVARVHIEDIEFLYNRFERSPAEMGETGKWATNLMLFPRAYWELIFKQWRKFTGKGMPFNERARAFKVLANIIIGGWLVGACYKKITGRRQNPYDPFQLLGYKAGGLALGSFELATDIYVDLIMASKGDKISIANLATELPKAGDMFIPFYDKVLRAIEASTNTKNIDVLALRKLRMLIDKEYKVRGGAYVVERNAMEKWQYFLAGAGVDVTIKEREKEEKELEPIIIGKPKIPGLGIPGIKKFGIKKLSPIKKF